MFGLRPHLPDTVSAMTGPIITLTLNPALDVSSAVKMVVPDHKLRGNRAVFEPGGGGVNVARVCRRLGVDAMAVVPIGGTIGDKVGQLLDAESLPWLAVPVSEETRQSFSITEAESGNQYRFVLPGPALTDAEITDCRNAVLDAAAETDCVVISGSLPRDADPRIVTELVQAMPGKSVIVDTSSGALKASLQSGARLIKPSARELANLVDRSLETEDDIEQAATEVLASSNVEILVASIGPGGAIAVAADGERVRVRAPTVKVRSAVGAGDSMVAGLAIGLHRGESLADTVALGVAAGTATVLSDGTGLCAAHDVERLLARVTTA